MDYAAWHAANQPWNQVQADESYANSLFGTAADELQSTRSLASTPASIIPDTPLMSDFGSESMDELPFPDGLSDASSDFGFMFANGSTASLDWNSAQSCENYESDHIPSSVSSTAFVTFPPELEIFLNTTDHSLTHGDSSAFDAPPPHPKPDTFVAPTDAAFAYEDYAAGTKVPLPAAAWQSTLNPFLPTLDSFPGFHSALGQGEYTAAPVANSADLLAHKDYAAPLLDPVWESLDTFPPAFPGLDSVRGQREDTAATVSIPDPDLSAHDICDAEAKVILGWQWQKSTTCWLDEGVFSEVCHFPTGLNITKNTKVYHVERVVGLPSQFPIPREATAFLIDLTNIPHLDDDSTVDAILKEQDVHSWDGSTGNRGKADAHIPGIFFGWDGSKELIPCRRAKPRCKGAFACESISTEFTNLERRELDPNSRDRIVAAQLRTRELQDSTRTGQVLAFLKSINDWRCGAVDPATKKACSGGQAVPKKLAQRRRNKNYVLVCSHREMHPCPTGHRTLEIPDHVDEDLFLRAVRGEKIVEDDEEQENECCRVYSARQGRKGKNICPFNHIKDGRPFTAKVVQLGCRNEMFVYCPHEDVYPALARKCIVVPDHKKPHTHPVPPLIKVTKLAAEKYKECVRKVGLGATVAKVEKAPSTREILGGLTPSQYHPGLINRDTKAKLIAEVEKEPEFEAKHQNQSIETYIAAQKTRPDEDRYIYVSEREGRTMYFGIKSTLIKYIHQLRALDCDTTFKPVAGKTNIYEINGWMASINQELTLARVWMTSHDRRSFQFVWEEFLSLVPRLTTQKITFRALHRGGTLLGVNADMEAAPLLGMADALLPTIDLPTAAETIEDAAGLIKSTVRICYTHVKRGRPDVKHLSSEDQDRIYNFMYMETPEDVEEFKTWIRTVPDPSGTILRWWEHKEMHEWLLPTIIQCLSPMDSNNWHVMEATTNAGEGQHAKNNQETGIGMGLVKSFIEYETLDTRRAAQIEQTLRTGNLHNPRNEVSHRYASRNTRRSNATAKAKQARADDEDLENAEQALADAQARVKLLRAEAKSNSSGRAPRPRKTQKAQSAQSSAKPSRRKDAAAEVPQDAAIADVDNALDEPISVCQNATIADVDISLDEPLTELSTSSRKRSGSVSVELDAPPKRLNLGRLKRWGVEREGVRLTAAEYAQSHWTEFKSDYPGLAQNILLDNDVELE